MRAIVSGSSLRRGGFDHVQRAHLRAALRGAVGDELAIVRGVPPVERDGAVFGKLVRIDQNFVVAVNALANVEHRLVLLAVATRVEVIVAADLGVAQIADLEQLLHAVVQLVAAGQLVENAARVGQLLGDPLLRLGSAAVFQPAVRVDNLVAEVVVGDRLLFGCGRFGNIHCRWSAVSAPTRSSSAG